MMTRMPPSRASLTGAQFSRAAVRSRGALPRLAAWGVAICLVAGSVALEAGGVLAQPNYGQATVEQGSLLLVRGAKRFEYQAGDPAVVVGFGDVLAVRPVSRVVMETVEGVRLVLGGNSVFEAKPFERKERRGVLRMLYGRLRASVTRLITGERFNMKTAQGVIGVKGTEFFTSVTAQGDTLVAVEETDHEVSLQGLEGPERALSPQVMAVVVNSQPVSAAAIVTPAIREQIATDVLESPAVYTEEAKEVPAEASLIEAGIVSEDDLVQAKRERVTLQDVLQLDERAEPLDEQYELSPQATDEPLRRNFLLRPRP